MFRDTNVLFTSRKQHVFTKGAVERVLAICDDVQTADGTVKLDSTMEATILENVEALAEQGLRVLCLATKAWTEVGSEPKREDVEGGLTLLGLVGLYGEPHLCSAYKIPAADLYPFQTLRVRKLRAPFANATTPAFRCTCSREITTPRPGLSLSRCARF